MIYIYFITGASALTCCYLPPALLAMQVVEGSNVLVLREDGTWVLGRALGKVYEEDTNTYDHDNATIPAHTKCIQVYQYEVLRPDADPFKATYCLRTNAGLCDEQWCSCGVDLPLDEGGPCYKQHTQTYRLRDLREPVNFRLSTPRAMALRTASAVAAASTTSRSQGSSSTPAPLRYYIDSLTKQKVKQGLDAMPCM